MEKRDPEAPTRVVVVEDQPAFLRKLVRVLGAHPREVEVVGTAMSGEQGLALCAQLQPQLVLLDLELPGIDGIEVTRRLKQAQPACDVLILTTFDDETKVFEAVRAGASGYLVKRVGPERILDAIADARAGGVVIEPVIARRFWNYFQSQQTRGEAPKPQDNAYGLAPLELEVLRFLAKGLSNAEVGRVMKLERRTVRTHLSHVYRKMGVHTHVEAVTLALRAGLIEL